MVALHLETSEGAVSGELSDAALTPVPQASGGLLEREEALALLRAATASAAAGAGRIAVVSGEAGIGKTALARRFAAELADPVRVLWGACDDLAVARPFGPFWDIAEQTGPALSAAIAAQDAGAVGQALRDVLADGRPCVCVLEDCHWADEATLDVIAHVGRRIARSPAVLLLTFRDDELTLEHRLRAVVGSIPPDDVVRIPLEPLSPAAVAALSAGATDAAALHSATRGNPFLVSEVLASGPGAVPGSVQDAVLARTARLSDSGRSLAELVSVLPSRAELQLIEAALPESADALVECTRLSVLELDGTIVRFRHELARQALEAALSEVERRRLTRSSCSACARPAPIRRVSPITRRARATARSCSSSRSPRRVEPRPRERIAMPLRATFAPVPSSGASTTAGVRRRSSCARSRPTTPARSGWRSRCRATPSSSGGGSTTRSRWARPRVRSRCCTCGRAIARRGCAGVPRRFRSSIRCRCHEPTRAPMPRTHCSC